MGKLIREVDRYPEEDDVKFCELLLKYFKGVIPEPLLSRLKENIPMGAWSIFCTPESFMNLPPSPIFPSDEKNLQENKISVGKPKVERVKKIKDIYWSHGRDYIRLSDGSCYYEDLNVHVKTEDYSDGDSVKITIRGKDGNPLFGNTKKLDLNGIISNNEVVFENVLEGYVLV